MSRRDRQSDVAIAQATAICAAWNEHAPEGTEVERIDDFGARHRTRTRSAAYVTPNGYAMIQVVGVSGGYLLSRMVRV